MKYTIIGDVHGKFRSYKTIIKSVKNSIQLGDMGVGFKHSTPDGPKFSANPPYDLMVKQEARFLRGNHDNPQSCLFHSQWISDGHCETTDSGTKLMFIGGAWSIDSAYRTEGLDWWPDEELSIESLYEIYDIYDKFRPDIMFTHDCPDTAANNMFAGDMRFGKFKTRTSQALEAMFNIHQPKYHFFGHWHISRRMNINGTNFVCLNELETMELDL
jgi:hypothetical protein